MGRNPARTSGFSECTSCSSSCRVRRTPLRFEGRVEAGPTGHSALGTSSTWVETRRGLRVSPSVPRARVRAGFAAPRCALRGASKPARRGTLHSVLPLHGSKPGADFGFLRVYLVLEFVPGSPPPAAL